MNIIITGNIGCGKSTVMEKLKKEFPHYNYHSVDAMVHDLYDNTKFNLFLLNTFGTTDRAKVSDIVFNDQAKKTLLENESLSYLWQAIDAVIKTPNVILEFPLFFEMGAAQRYGKRVTVVAITCSDAVQLARIKSRDNFSDEKIASIRASQLSTELKSTLSDLVIPNDGNDLDNAVNHLANKLRVVALAERANTCFQNDQVWKKIKAAYSQPHRAYHTLEHLAAMFAHFDEHKAEIAHPLEVELAIWFHDFVYNTDGDTYGENEANSVKAMFDMVAEIHRDERSVFWKKPTPTQLHRAAEYILSTKGHTVKAPSVLADPTSRQSNEYFLDIDLSILGQPTSTCDVFDDQIRKEFSQHNNDQFRRGRIQAMSAFVARKRVYFTDAFGSKYEAQAKSNLQYIISKWS